jgi:hypothetical protein
MTRPSASHAPGEVWWFHLRGAFAEIAAMNLSWQAGVVPTGSWRQYSWPASVSKAGQVRFAGRLALRHGQQL